MTSCEDSLRADSHPPLRPPRPPRAQLSTVPPNPTVHEKPLHFPRLLCSRYGTFLITLVVPGTFQRRLGGLQKKDGD